MNYVGYAALSLVAGSTLYFIKRETEVRAEKALQPKVNDLVTRIRSLLPILNGEEKSSILISPIPSKESSYDGSAFQESILAPPSFKELMKVGEKSRVSESMGNPRTFNVYLPSENEKEVLVSFKIENIKTLFFKKYAEVVEVEDKYFPWLLKIISRDSMDEHTSKVVKRALDKLNEELRTKSKKAIREGYAIAHCKKYYKDGYWWNETHWSHFIKATYENYGRKHYSSELNYNMVMKAKGYEGNLI
jgi:hypothetical protein